MYRFPPLPPRMTTPSKGSALRDSIIKLLYEEAPGSPWLSDKFYDKLLSLVESDYISKIERERDESLRLMKSTALGVVANNARIKIALTKGLETLGLAQSMIRGGEVHSAKSQTMFEEAVGAMHNALKFMSEEPTVESGSLSAQPGYSVKVTSSPTITCAECGKPTANFVENFCTSCFRLREGI